MLIQNVKQPVPLGLMDVLESAGLRPSWAPDGLHVTDSQAAQALINGYDGSAAQLQANQSAILLNLASFYAATFVAGFNYTGQDNVSRNFQIDAVSQFNVDATANAALGIILDGEPAWDATFYWIASDNSHMPLATPAAMRTFAIALKSYCTNLVLRNRVLKDQIAAASDIKTLNAIDITAGWPSN